MHVCIIGSGLTGLAAAHLLAAHPHVSVTILEQSARFGGRAGVTEEGEHCPRFLLDDYSYMFALLNEIPFGDGSVADVVGRVRRLARSPSGKWVEISHVYASRARELTVRDRWMMAKGTHASLLVAKRSPDTTNIFGSGANYSVRTVISMARNIKTSRSAYALPGDTNQLLIAPWVEHLASRGVAIRSGAAVDRIRVHDDKVEVVTRDGSECFDAVLVTAFVHGAYDLLDRSEVPRPLDWRRHANCKCFTLDLDPREHILRDPTQRAFTSAGLLLLLQPAAGRCIALTTTTRSTAEDYVLDCVREALGLSFGFLRVRARDNLAANDGVFAGECVDPVPLEDAVARTRAGDRRVFFAGSYTVNSYPVDSAESACRSAFAAVERLAKHHPDEFAGHQTEEWRSHRRLPVAMVGGWTEDAYGHPNARGGSLTTGLLWHLAYVAGVFATAPVVRMTVLDVSELQRPHPTPLMYVARSRHKHDGLIGLLTFARVRARPRLILPEPLFCGFAGKALQSIGALPAISGSGATATAVAALLRAGESVALNVSAPPGANGVADDLYPYDVAMSTSTSIVPIGAWGTLRPRAGPAFAMRRRRVVVAVGAPICPGDTSAVDLRTKVYQSINLLEAMARHTPSAVDQREDPI